MVANTNHGVVQMEKDAREELYRTVREVARDVESAPLDVLDHALDVTVLSDLSGEYRGAIIQISTRGPEIWIDTSDGCVHGIWGGDSVILPVSRDALDAIDDEIYDAWRCR